MALLVIGGRRLRLGAAISQNARIRPLLRRFGQRLHIGAPVKFKGVEIGSVKDIKLEMGLGNQVHKIPVIIEIDLKKVIRRGVTREKAMDPNTIREFVTQGLRGQLQTESLVTGVLYVALDWFPETPLNFVQPAGDHFQYEEIPTVPSELEQAHEALVRVVKKIDDIDFKRLIDSLAKTSDGVGQLVSVNSPTREIDSPVDGPSDAATSRRDL